MRLPRGIDRLRRKLFGRYEIDDPRAIAAEAPYTFFLPSPEELQAVSPGDLVKLTVRSIPQSPTWDAERMWVTVEDVDCDRLTGHLGNAPYDMPQLPLGSRLIFARHQIIDIIWAEERPAEPPPQPAKRTFWERCLVDCCVTSDRVPIHYLYREEPEPSENDAYSDSGWRIRGDYRGLTNEEIDARETEYVALGRVLNADDSWLHLIDAPIGSAFLRDWDTGTFVPEAWRE